MKKKILLVLLAVLLLTGCSNKQKIVIYSCMEEERNQVLTKQLKETFADYDVVVESISTGNSAAKIKTEKENVEADIILDLENAHMVSVKDYFAPLKEFDTSMFNNKEDVQSTYVTWIKYTMSLIIDKDYFEKNNIEIPKTYEDLLKDEYKGLIAMPDPKTSGTGYAFFLNAVNLMGENKAVEYFNKLKNNVREFTTSGSGPTNLLKQGEIAIAMGMTTQGVAAINEGYNFQIIELDTGSPYNTTSAGIILGKEENAAVREIFQWLISSFAYYDKEYFMPCDLLKGQKTSIKNYPEKTTYSKMDGWDSMETKEEIMKLWDKVNG